MYGVVNNAVQEFVLESQGMNIWLAIKEKAGLELELESFNSMQSYPDEITYNLVAAASEILDLPAEVILEEFGKHWIKYASNLKGHSHYFRLGDEGFYGFIRNLDRMHLNITRTYSELQPPSFLAEKVSENELLLKYYSNRDGLRPFVKGLLLGLGTYFGLQIKVESDPRTVEELGGFSLFKVIYN